MKSFEIIRRAAMTVIGLAALSACSDSSTDQSTGGGSSAQGKAQVLLTDAPFPYANVARVDVYVTSISILKADPSSAQLADTTTASGWVTVARPGKTFNLVALRGGTTADLGIVTLDTGSYSGLRMIIDQDLSSITLTDGTVYTKANSGLSFPSGSTSGIKVILSSAVAVGTGTTVFVVDYDLANSFILRGSAPTAGFIFRPVLRGFLKSSTGRLSGTVKDSATATANSGATVQLVTVGTSATDTTAANLIASTSTDANGAFAFELVPPGSYQVRVFKTSTTTTGMLTSSTAVTAGGSVALAIKLGVTLTLGAARSGF